MLISLKKGHFLKKPVDRDRGDDVIMTSLNRVLLYSYINNPTKFGEDRMQNTQVIVFTDRHTHRHTDIAITIPLVSAER